jgi:adenosine deaminase CECR1
MTLYGLRQLAEWSIEHSCLEDEAKDKVKLDWKVMWDKFCRWIVTEYGPLVDETPTKLES